MLKRNWRGILTVVGGLGLVGLFYTGYKQLEDADLHSYPDYKYQPARDRVPAFPEDASITPKTYHPNCDNPKDRDDADLCAQWAAVQAVEEGNRLARYSIRITAIEFGALVFSLIFTGWAALAAARAARAADDAIEMTREASVNQLRAYLGIDKMDVVLEVGKHPLVQVHIVNAGQTPARKVISHHHGFPTKDPHKGKVSFSDISWRSKLDIGPGRPFTFNIRGGDQLTQQGLAALQAKEIYWVVAGFITYRDIWNKTRRTIFRGYVTIGDDGKAHISSTTKGNRSS